MKTSPLKNPRSVALGTLSVLIGILAYCLVIAPLLSHDPYRVASWNTFQDVGLGFGFAVIIVGIIWQIVLIVILKKGDH